MDFVEGAKMGEKCSEHFLYGRDGFAINGTYLQCFFFTLVCPYCLHFALFRHSFILLASLCLALCLFHLEIQASMPPRTRRSITTAIPQGTGTDENRNPMNNTTRTSESLQEPTTLGVSMGGGSICRMSSVLLEV